MMLLKNQLNFSGNHFIFWTQEMSLKIIRIFFLLFLLFSLPLFAQEEEKGLFALRINEPVEIDGFLKEAGWKEAPKANDFIWAQLEKQRPASARTDIKILYDDNFIYIGFLCYDPQPMEVAAQEKTRDADLRDDDSVYLLFDMPHDKDYFYYFGSNLLGTQFDGRIALDGRTADSKWNGVWKSAGQRTDFGWSAEIAIDFSCLKYKPGKEESFGLILSRIVPRMLESIFWSGPLDPAFKISQIGQLKRLSFGKGERKVQITPYILPNNEQGRNSRLGAGLDLNFSFSRMASGLLTLNPDFATVEPDQERLNLTRYELYVPEKRNFFQGGPEVYGQPISLFYSKRIPDIYGGLKLSGRSGAFEYSGMSVQAKRDDSAGEDSANYSLFRVKKYVMDSSAIGFLAANKMTGGKSKGAAGIDAALSFAENFKFAGQFAASYGDYNKGNIAFFLCPAYESETLHLHFSYSHLGENFADNVNEIGFIRDDNRRELDSALQEAFLINKGGVDQVVFRTSYNAFWGVDGTFRSWQIDESLTVDLTNKFSLIFLHSDDFKAEDNVLYEKDFRNNQTKLGIGFNTKEWEMATISVSFGRNFGQGFNMIEMGKNLQITRSLSVEYELARVYFGYGRYARNDFAHTLRVTNYLTENLSLKIFYQAHTIIDKLNFKALFTYRFLPPSGFAQLAYLIGGTKFGEPGTEGDTIYLKFFYTF